MEHVQTQNCVEIQQTRTTTEVLLPLTSYSSMRFCLSCGTNQVPVMLMWHVWTSLSAAQGQQQQLRPPWYLHICVSLSASLSTSYKVCPCFMCRKRTKHEKQRAVSIIWPLYNCIRRRVSNTLCLHIISHYTLLMAETVKWLHIQ